LHPLPQRTTRLVTTTPSVDAALKGDDSLFTPGRSVWNAEAIQDLFHRYVEADTSRDKLEIKLARQIADANDGTRQLAAELLYVHLLLPCDTKADKKRGMVKTLLAPLRPEVTIPDELSQPLDPGIATIGAALAWQSAQFTYLLRLVRFWRSVPLDERSSLLADPGAFKNFLYADRVPLGGAGVQREALLYLLFVPIQRTSCVCPMPSHYILCFVRLVTTDVAHKEAQAVHGGGVG